MEKDDRKGSVRQPALYSLNTLPNVTSVHFALARDGFLVHELGKFPLEPRYPLSINCIPPQGAPQASYRCMRKVFLPFLPDFFLYLPPDSFWLSVAPFHAEKQTEIDICVSFGCGSGPAPNCKLSEALPQSHRRSCKASWGCLSNLSARIRLKTYRGKTLKILLVFVRADPTAVPVSSTRETNSVGLLAAQTN